MSSAVWTYFVCGFSIVGMRGELGVDLAVSKSRGCVVVLGREPRPEAAVSGRALLLNQHSLARSCPSGESHH